MKQGGVISTSNPSNWEVEAEGSAGLAMFSEREEQIAVGYLLQEETARVRNADYKLGFA